MVYDAISCDRVNRNELAELASRSIRQTARWPRGTPNQGGGIPLGSTGYGF
jgi:hypothetical protein